MPQNQAMNRSELVLWFFKLVSFGYDSWFVNVQPGGPLAGYLDRYLPQITRCSQVC